MSGAYRGALHEVVERLTHLCQVFLQSSGASGVAANLQSKPALPETQEELGAHLLGYLLARSACVELCLKRHRLSVRNIAIHEDPPQPAMQLILEVFRRKLT